MSERNGHYFQPYYVVYDRSDRHKQDSDLGYLPRSPTIIYIQKANHNTLVRIHLLLGLTVPTAKIREVPPWSNHSSSLVYSGAILFDWWTAADSISGNNVSFSRNVAESGVSTMYPRHYHPRRLQMVKTFYPAALLQVTRWKRTIRTIVMNSLPYLDHRFTFNQSISITSPMSVIHMSDRLRSYEIGKLPAPCK